MSEFKSEKLLNEILIKIVSLSEIYSGSNIIQQKNLSEPILNEINESIKTLFNLSIEENFYFLDCPFNVYKDTYETRLILYFDENQTEDESLFLKEELNTLINPVNNKYKVLRNYFQNKLYNISFNSKITFIREKLSNLGWVINLDPEFNGIPKNFEYDNNMIIIKERFDPSLIKKFDVSGANKVDSASKKEQLTANQIVILLDKIAFFTYPIIENASKVKQANLIKLITGIHEKTIKTSIEKLDNKSLKDTDNYQKDIDKIDQILRDL